jgi:hypothetical protein
MTAPAATGAEDSMRVLASFNDETKALQLGNEAPVEAFNGATAEPCKVPQAIKTPTADKTPSPWMARFNGFKFMVVSSLKCLNRP